MVYCADQDFEHILLLRFLRMKIGFGDILSVILRQHLESLHVLFVLYLSSNGLPTTITSLQRPLFSVRKVAVVEMFNCIDDKMRGSWNPQIKIH